MKGVDVRTISYGIIQHLSGSSRYVKFFWLKGRFSERDERAQPGTSKSPKSGMKIVAKSDGRDAMLGDMYVT